MAKFKSIALVSLAALAFCTPSVAADLMVPPPAMPPAMVEAPAPVDDFSGWYIRGDVGYGLHSASSMTYLFPANYQYGNTYTFDKPTLANGFLFGGGFGYQFNSWLRADITLDYRGNIAGVGGDKWVGLGNSGSGTNTYRYPFSSIVTMANLYADLGTWYGITPYVGAGAGVAYNSIGQVDDYANNSATATGKALGASKASFAWALMAGASYDLTQRLKLDFGYRYLNMGDAASGEFNCNVSCKGTTANDLGGGTFAVKGIQSHDFRLGLRYVFGAPAAPVAMPVVARY